MRASTLFLLWGACAYAQGGIDGVALNRADGKPLAGVHVRLFSGGFDGIKEVYGALSDKAGHFSISPMKPGAYFLLPEYPGFLYVPPKSDSPVPAIQIKPGEKLEGFKLEMTPHAVLAGRVVDEYGDPVANVPVQATPVSPEDQVIDMFGSANPRTDDRGEFRIVTRPGKFYIKAEPFTNTNEQPEIRSDGTSEVVYGPSFYPSAASKERASAIEAAAGHDVSGLEIRLVRQRSFTISGTVTGIPDASARAMIIMRYGEGVQQLANMRNFVTEADGRFSLNRLAPGVYRLYAQYNSGGRQLQSGTVDVKLDSADQTGVELSLNGGGELTGTLEAAGLPAERRTVRLQPVDPAIFMPVPLTGDVDRDGAFKIANVPAGKYRVVVSPLPDNGYVKTVQLDGATAINGVLDLSRGAHGSRVKILASAGAAQISGRVLDKDGKPITDSLTVLLLMTDPNVRDEDAMTRVSGSDGSYSKKGIRPGKYRIFALDLFHYVGDAASGGDDMTEPFSRGEEIEIKENDKIVKDIKVLEKPDARKQ